MSSVVVDTNVFAVAEGMHEGATQRCIDHCLALLGTVEAGKRKLQVDDGDRVLAEYVKTLNAAGTSGLAVKLAKRLWRMRHASATCDRIPITPKAQPPGVFDEVPAILGDFDEDDQKFFAIANASQNNPEIYQALDTEWWERRQDMAAAGLDVQFLCAADL
jgi:hypothetical protein